MIWKLQMERFVSRDLDYECLHFSSGIAVRAKCERGWKSPHARKGSRVVIFTRARVSLALLSLRKNGDYSLCTRDSNIPPSSGEVAIFYYCLLILLCPADLDHEQPLFFLSPSSKTRETRKWPRASLKARYGRGLPSRALSRALPSLNLKKKRDCSQCTLTCCSQLTLIFLF